MGNAYTKKEMVNHLMRFEEDYIGDNLTEHPKYTVDSWLSAKYKEYSTKTEDNLARDHRDIVDNYYDGEKRDEEIAKRFKDQTVSGNRRLWVK